MLSNSTDILLRITIAQITADAALCRAFADHVSVRPAIYVLILILIFNRYDPSLLSFSIEMEFDVRLCGLSR